MKVHDEAYCRNQILTDEWLWDLRYWRKRKDREEVLEWIRNIEKGIIDYKNCGHTVSCIELLLTEFKVPVEEIADLVMRNDKIKYPLELGTLVKPPKFAPPPPKIPEPWTRVVESIWARLERPAFTKRDLERLVRWIYDECESLGIDPTLIDIYAMLDPTLSIYENVGIIAETMKFAPPEWYIKPPKVPRVVVKPPKLPPTLEEVAVCPLDPKRHPLTRFPGPVEIGIPVTKTISIQERLKREYRATHPEWAEWEVAEAARREVWRRTELGQPTTEVVTELEKRKVSIPVGFLIYHDDVRECAGYCRFYEVRDLKLHSMTYDELVERIRKAYVRILKPVIPAPPPPRIPVVGAPIVPPTPREVEIHPKFHEWLEERKMTLEAYFALPEETKRALRDAFFRTYLELWRGRLP